MKRAKELTVGKNIITLIAVSGLLITLSLFLAPVFINPFTLGSEALSLDILINIRLPRLITALLIGASLGASGAVLQAILRNPLADPYILGISSGSALFAAIGLALGLGAAWYLSIPALAFLGAIITSLIVGSMGSRGSVVYPGRLLLAGIGLGFLFTAALLLILSLSSNEGLRKAMLWIFGDLSMAEPALLPLATLLVGVALAISLRKVRALNALMLGDDAAHSLGFNPSRQRIILFASAALMTSAAVSLGGVIGFVGLLVPHIVRFLTGSDSRVVLPLSALLGATLLCVADAIGKTVISPTEIPSGIITALLGAPFFLYLLKRKEVLGE